MEEVKVMSTVEAYRLYLSQGYDAIMPFNSVCENSFLDLLGSQGIVVMDEVAVDGESGSN